jgi:hypothetical protein
MFMQNEAKSPFVAFIFFASSCRMAPAPKNAKRTQTAPSSPVGFRSIIAAGLARGWFAVISLDIVDMLGWNEVL